MPRSKPTKNPSEIVEPARELPPRVVVSYLDGTWSDRLQARRAWLETDPQACTIVIELVEHGRSTPAKKQEAVRHFVTRRNRVDSVLIHKARFAARLSACLKGHEGTQMGVRLVADGHEVLYPASVVFGPDAITLNLG